MSSIVDVLSNLANQTGFASLDWKNYVMILVAFVFMFLAIKFGFEPLLLVPISFGMLLVNMFPDIMAEGGLLHYFYMLDEWSILPSLIFMGVGAMTDFGPLIANPASFLLGAAAQFGIYGAYFLAFLMGFNGKEAAAISIIGGADGPTSIFLAGKLGMGGTLLGPIAVAAYSYMSLVPIIQPPIMKALTTKKERLVRMPQLRPVTKLEKILFPIIVTVVVVLILPTTAPLVGMLMLGNLFKESGVVKQLTESEFTPNYGIDVSINLVQGTIMEAVLAGKGPDVAMFVGGEFPVNLAIRNLLVPLDDLDGFDEVKGRFQDTAMVHYTYDNQTYGIPITRTFPMMFYRKDVLSEIGITEPPETWDDLIDMLPAIQRKYMQPGLILPANVNGNAVAPSTEVGHTFAMLMLQSGLNYYNDEQTETTFDSVEAVNAFDTWTKFYTTYKFDQTYDAFSRFRTGEAPIVIQNYCTFYNQLNVAAPEIKGAWDFCPVPGTRREDGTISHAANSSGSGFIILKDCKNVEGAWEYIKWFTSTDTMITYGQNVEGVMGPLGRFESANVEALQKLNWSKSDLTKINAQLNELDEIPIIPSSYVVTRSIMNAFRSVVNDNENARETLRWYNKDINAEITRKRKNLGLDE